jgi:integrase
MKNEMAMEKQVEPNIYLRTQTYTMAYVVRINKGGVKVNRNFSFLPENEAAQDLALLKARNYRDAESFSILLSGESATKTSLLTLQAVSVEYESKITAGKKGAEIETQRLQKLRRDYPKIFATPIVKLKRADFEELRDELVDGGLNAWTVNRYLSIFSGMFKYAQKRDGQEWVQNLTDGLSVKTKNKEMRNFDHTVFQKIIETTTSPILRLALEIGLSTGMRRSEIATLRWHQVHLKSPVPYIEIIEGKNGEGRKIPISKILVKRLSAFKTQTSDDWIFKSNLRKEGKAPHIDPHSISKAFERAKKKLIKDGVYTKEEIADLKFHSSRGRFIIDLVLRKVDVLTTSKLSGHKTLTVLNNNYYKPTVEELAERIGLKK